VSFEPLNPETIRAITAKELAELAEREGCRRAGLRLCWTQSLVDWLAREGFNVRYGARPLQRLLEKRVVSVLAKFLLNSPDLRDAELRLDYTATGVNVSIATSAEVT
jgi:ATP-dependent Clp protease ATP-binding subunit ClpC